jgi:ADP-heptose:LPS heptosyltransferase
LIKQIELNRNIKDTLLKAYFLLRMPLIHFLTLLPVGTDSKTGEVSDILIIRLDRMGDFILSLPVIEDLKLQHPKARITVIVKPYLRELAGIIRSIDKVIIYESFFVTMKEMRKKQYDIVIDMLCDYKLTSAALAYMSGAPVRVGFAWGYRELFFTASIDHSKHQDKGYTALSLELLGLLNVPAVITVPKISLSETVSSGQKIVAIHPGGYYQSQRWPLERFAALARLLVDEMKEEIILIGGPEDKQIVRGIINEIGERNVRFIYPGLKDMALILKDCKVLICNNSGPLHFAAALGVPTVSTMGPTDRTLWRPVGDNAIVVDRGNDVTRISVDDMYEAVKKVIGRSS